MQKHMKRMLGYLLAIIIFLSDIPIVVSAEETVDAESSSVETVVDAPESEIEENVSTSEEAQIVSELTEKRDETTKYFAMSDGTTKACIYPQNIHYLDEGEYKEIDNTLIEEAEDSKTYYKNKKNSFSVKIPEYYGDDYIEFSDENGYVKFKLKGATNKKIEKIEKEKAEKNKDKTLVDNVNDKAIFKSIKGNIDIEYDVTGNKLKETIVLYKKTKNAFVFDVRTSADKVILNNDNSVSFFDKEDVELYTIESPYMMDAAGDYSNDIKTTLVGLDDAYTITYKPNYEWLSAKERVYPVKIDPTMFKAIYKETVADTYVTNAQTASDTRGYWDIMNIGKRHTTTGGEQIVLRGLIKFNIPSEIGGNDCIVDAKLDLVHCNYEDYVTNNGIQIDVHELTSSFSEGSTWWDNQPSYNPVITDYAIVNTGNYFSGTSLSYDSYNLTRLVNRWHTGEPNYGIILKLHDDTSSVSSRQQVYYFAKQSTYYGTVSKFVEITYRNAVGLEDYWSYTTQDFGQYGTGYVNNYNGNLVYVHEDTSFNSLINGFTLSHVYNTNSTRNEAGYFGKGWGINLVQYIEPASITGNSYVKYKYTDGDGTEHYFIQNSDGKIVDEDGLGYTYTAIDETVDNGTTPLSHQITTKDNVILKFDTWSCLRRIIDLNGNTISLNYSPGPTLDNNKLTSIFSSSGERMSLAYDSNNLVAITDNSGRITRFTYSNQNLALIEYPDGTSLNFNYNENGWLQEITSPNNTKLQYTHYSPSGKISLSKFYGTDNSVSSTISFDYLQNQTHITDSENRGLTYQFDTFGRVTCVYDDNQTIYTQTYNPTSIGSSIFANNKLTSISNKQTYVNNLLSNSSFTNGTSEWIKYQENPNSVVSVVSDTGLLTSKSIKITSEGNSVEVIVQKPLVTSERTYTFSGYIKSNNVQSATHGAGLEVVVTDGNSTRSIFSKLLIGTTDSEIDKGFEHLSVTFTLKENETIQHVAAGIYLGSGTVYIDSLQLEEGESANHINLIENSGFERNNGDSTALIGYSSHPNNTYTVTSMSRSGSASCKILGEATQPRSMNQPIALSGKAGDAYTVGAWAKAYAVSNHKTDKVNNADFALHVFTYNNNVEAEHILIKFNEYISDWQYTAKTFILTKDYTSIVIYCSFDYNCNIAYFDNIFLYRDTMQSYSYDKDGNVVSTADYSNQNESFYYNQSNLAKLITPIGSGYEYQYNAKNNMTFARSSEGLGYEIKYDEQGNAISANITNHSYSTSVQEGKIYYIRLKGDGKYLTVENAGIEKPTNVVVMPFSAGNNQKWKIESIEQNCYVISPQHTDNMSLEVANGTDSELTNVQINLTDNTLAQKFKIVPQSDYTYKIIAECSTNSKILTVNHAPIENNVSILSNQGNNNEDQEWIFEDIEQPPVTEIEDGVIYQFRARHSGRCIDIRNGVNDVGTLVQQYECNYTVAQKYILNRYEDSDYFTFTTCIDNNKKLEISSGVNSAGYKYFQLGDNTITDSKLFKFEYNTQKKRILYHSKN